MWVSGFGLRYKSLKHRIGLVRGVGCIEALAHLRVYDLEDRHGSQHRRASDQTEIWS